MPITPATAGPELMPRRNTRGWIPTRAGGWYLTMSRAMLARAWAWSSLGTGTPDATMYASPMVRIFSRPYRSANESKYEKTSLRRSTSPSALMAREIGVKPTTSANRTDTAGKLVAIVCSSSFSCCAICIGSTLSSSLSDFSCSRWSIEKASSF